MLDHNHGSNIFLDDKALSHHKQDSPLSAPAKDAFPPRRRFPWLVVVLCVIAQEILAIFLVVHIFCFTPALTPTGAVLKYQLYLNGLTDNAEYLTPPDHWRYLAMDNGNSVEDEVFNAKADALDVFYNRNYRYGYYNINLQVTEISALNDIDEEVILSFLKHRGINTTDVDAYVRLTVRGNLYGSEKDEADTGYLYAVQINGCWYLIARVVSYGNHFFYFVTDEYLYRHNF